MGVLLNRRRYMGCSVLPYDEVVEYIVTKRGLNFNVVDLGIAPNEQTDAVEITFMLLEASQQDRFLHGENWCMELYINSGNYYGFHRKSGTQDSWNNTFVSIFTSAEKETIKIDYANNTYTIRNNTVPFTAGNAFSWSKIMLFNDTANNYKSPAIRLYGVKYWKSGTIVRDLIPVRIGQLGCLYDNISETIFANTGTGDFIPAKPLESATFIEYIECTGSQWINTGISLNNIENWEMEFDITPTRFYDYNPIFCLGNDTANESWIYNNGNFCVRLKSAKSDNVPLTINRRILLKITYVNNNTYNIYIDNVLKHSKNCGPITSNYFLWLFHREMYAELKIYGFKLSLNGVPTLNLVPIRRGTIGMLYDSINNKDYINRGSNDFILGNDL